MGAVRRPLPRRAVQAPAPRPLRVLRSSRGRGACRRGRRLQAILRRGCTARPVRPPGRGGRRRRRWPRARRSARRAESPTVHEVDLDEALSRNELARAIMSTTTLDEVEALSREVCGFSEIDYERNKALWLKEQRPTKLDAESVLAQLDQSRVQVPARARLAPGARPLCAFAPGSTPGAAASREWRAWGASIPSTIAPGRAEQTRPLASRSFVQWRAPPGRQEPRPLHSVWADGRRDGSWRGWWWRQSGNEP